MLREIYYLKLKDEICICRSPVTKLNDKMLVLRNIKEAEIRRSMWDRNIQDLGVMILKQHLRVSKIAKSFQDGENDILVEESDKEWIKICLKFWNAFMPTKVMILQIFIEVNIKTNTNDDMDELDKDLETVE